MLIEHSPQQWRFFFGRHRQFAHHPSEQIGRRHIEQLLVIVEIRVAQAAQLTIGEPAEHEIDFADAAMPGAKQQPPPPLIQSLARSSGHVASNANSPDGAGWRLYRGGMRRCHRAWLETLR